jgi:uncharacterized membrane protein
VGGFFGLVALVLGPPLQIADSPAHAFRIYQLSQGELISQRFSDHERERVGGLVPWDFAQTVSTLVGDVPFQPTHKVSLGKEISELKLGSNKTPIQVPFEGSAVYSPTTYIPQVVGFWAGSIFSSAPIVWIYFARVFNLITWMILVYLSIRIIPYGRWVLAVFALLPMAVYQSASISPDPMAIGLVYIFVAYLLRLAHRGKPASAVEYATLICLALLIALSKSTYAAVIPLVLILSPEVMSRLKQVLVISAGALITFLWILLVTPLTKIMISNQHQSGHVDPAAQIHSLITDPIHAVAVVGQTFLGRQSDYILSSFIGLLGYGDTHLKLWVIIGGYALIALTFVLRGKDNSKPVISNAGRLTALAIWILSCAGVFLALYLTYNDVGAGRAEGVQGRYFLPLAILWIPILYRLLPRLDVERPPIAASVAAGSTILLTASMIDVYLRFY